MYHISRTGNGTVVDSVVSAGLILGQSWTVSRIDRTGTGAVLDCIISMGLAWNDADCVLSVGLVLEQ